MFDTDKIDINNLFDKGYCVAQMEPAMADIMLRQLKKEMWMEVQPDAGGLDTGDAVADKYYRCRQMSVRTLLQPDNPRRIYMRYVDAFKEWAKPVLSKFETGDVCSLSAFCGTTGYYMDPHTDVGDRAVFDVIAYFGNDIEKEEDGGLLKIYKTSILDPENRDNHVHIDTIMPRHGMVVVLNNLNPTFYHEVTELVKKDAKRYQLFSIFGAPQVSDWYFDFKEIPGFVHTKDPVSIGDADSVLKAIEKPDIRDYPQETFLVKGTNRTEDSGQSKSWIKAALDKIRR